MHVQTRSQPSVSKSEDPSPKPSTEKTDGPKKARPRSISSPSLPSLSRQESEKLTGFRDDHAPLTRAPVRSDVPTSLFGLQVQETQKKSCGHTHGSEPSLDVDHYGGIDTRPAPQVLLDCLNVHNRMPTRGEWRQATVSRDNDNRGTHIPELLTIDNFLVQYGVAGTDRQRIRILGRIERDIYAALSTYNEAPREGSRGPALLALLDCVQNEHERISANMTGLELARACGVPPGERALMAGILSGNQGQFSFDDRPRSNLNPNNFDPQVAGYSNKVRSALARLMQNPTARQLLTDIANHGGPETVMIRPPRPGQDQNPFTDRIDNHNVHINDPIGPGPVVASYSDIIHRTLRDSEEVVSGTRQGGLFGGNPRMVTPFWLSLGHELIHARHNQLGTNQRRQPINQQQGQLWSNPEERYTISQDVAYSENILRQESGLRIPRHGHRVQ